MNPRAVPICISPGSRATACLRAAFWCAALASMPTAFAANKNLLYKCVDAAGVVSIQSEACPKGSTQAWKRDATPEPALTPEQAAQIEAKTRRDQQTVREQLEIVDRKLQPPAPAAAPEPAAKAADEPASAPGEPAKELGGVDPCEAAQQFAGSVREKSWLALTEEQTRNLYSWVAEQCKSSPKAR